MGGVEKVEYPFKLGGAPLAVIKGEERQRQQGVPYIGEQGGFYKAIYDGSGAEAQEIDPLIFENKGGQRQQHADQTIVHGDGDAGDPG